MNFFNGGNMSKTQVHQEVIQANEDYAQSFSKGELPIFPGRKFAILTCMDARLDPAKFAGLEEGDAHIIRNAGGRASDDAIRSLIISHKLLGTNEWFLIQHTDCGMELFTDEIMGQLLEGSLKTAVFDGNQWSNQEGSSSEHSTEGHYLKWLTFKGLENNIVRDVNRIKNHPLVSSDIKVYGYIYDVRSGNLIAVA